MKSQAVPNLYKNDVSPIGNELPNKKDIKNENTAKTAKEIRIIRPIRLGGIAIQIL